MINRMIHEALALGWGSYLSDPGLIEALFSQIWLLGDQEVAAIGQFFRAKPPGIFQGYPRTALGNNPAMYIMLQNEAQPDFALNDFGGMAGGTAAAAGPATIGAGAGAPVLSSYWTHTYSIMFVAQNQPEPALWGYEVCKSILLAAKHFFLQRSVLNYSLSGGDVAPETAYEPDTLFARTLNFRCQRVFEQADPNGSLGGALNVQGLVLPPAGDPLPNRPPSRIQVLTRRPPADAT